MKLWEKNIDEFISTANKHNEKTFLRWNVLSFEDLITSKVKANRPKDLLDIQQLREIKNK